MNKVILVFVVCIGLITGCKDKPIISPPMDSVVAKNVAELYLISGVATSVEKQSIFGKHYIPATDIWKVVACVEYTLGDGKLVTDCNDSFTLSYMDSHKWIIAGTINGAYKWAEVLGTEQINFIE